MAKAQSPLMSMRASGMLGERLTFSVRESVQQVRFQRAQKDRLTEARDSIRSAYSSSVTAWNLLDPSEKSVFILRAKNLHMTGYNLFMRENFSLDSAEFGVMLLGANLLGFA